MKQDEDRIPSKPLFDRLIGAGASAAFARKMDISPQRLSNWKKRGIPATSLPSVAAKLGLSVEQYLEAAGRPIPRAEQPSAPYLTREEQQLVDSYRKASPGWQLTLTLLARTPVEDQPKLSRDMNILMTTIFGKAAPDSSLGDRWTRPDKKKIV